MSPNDKSTTVSNAKHTRPIFLGSKTGLACWQCESSTAIYNLPCHSGNICRDCLTQHWADNDHMITLQCPSCKAECGFQRPDSLPETLVSFNRTWYNELRQDREPYTHEILNGKIAFTKSEADIYLCATYEMVADTILDCTLLVDYDGTNEADKNHIFAEVHRQIADFLLSEKLCTTPLELKEDIKVLVSYLFSNNEKYGFAAKEYTDEDLVVYMAKCHGLTIAQDPSLSAVERRKNWKLQAKIWTSFSILFVDLVTRRHLQRFKVAEDGTY